MWPAPCPIDLGATAGADSSAESARAGRKDLGEGLAGGKSGEEGSEGGREKREGVERAARDRRGQAAEGGPLRCLG